MKPIVKQRNWKRNLTALLHITGVWLTICVCVVVAMMVEGKGEKAACPPNSIHIARPGFFPALVLTTPGCSASPKKS